MTWTLGIRGAATRLREAPFTEVPITDVHSLVYKVGVATIPNDGSDESQGEAGTFSRGGYRVSGFLFTFDSRWADVLLTMTEAVDLVLYYLAEGARRKRTIVDVLFCGDAIVTVPDRNAGLPELIGIPFRVQLPTNQILTDHIIDEEDDTDG
ncbi:MAG: hypothetical protein ACYTHJ_10125 [Planctomycetota bacterium]|jgi:hypothetical protein